MTDVYVEQGDLDQGVGLIFKPLNEGIRVMYDPGRMTETSALAELRGRLPQLDGARIVRLSRA